MPKKKGKKSKKKSESDEVGKTSTNLEIEGEGAQLGISKKKKGKKAKLSKEEKAAAKLAKQLEAFMSDIRSYELFLQKADKWMMRSKTKVEALFKRFDTEGDGIVTFEIFRAGLHDLLCPLTEIEIHALCRQLDPLDSGMIEYDGFERGIHNRVIDDEREEEQKLVPDDYSPELFLTKQAIQSGLNDPFHQDHPRYVRLNLRLATFDSVDRHPGHVTITVRTFMPITVLHDVIMEKSHIVSGELRVYSDRACQVEHRLPPTYTLEQCGIPGGPLRNPPSIQLYYDYVVEFTDCPLLNCDHYFGFEKRKAPP